MRLLVVEEDLSMQEFLRKELAQAGYVVEAAATGKTGEKLALERAHDALIIDLELPDMDGLELIARCRAQRISAPVLILSNRRTVEEVVRGLELGGDDYLTKPFALPELLARLKTLLRRTPLPQAETNTLQVGDLRVDLVRREAKRGDRILRLTPREFSLLEYLCRNPGRIVTRSMILENVWRINVAPTTNVVDVLMYRLRSEVNLNSKKPLIFTVRGEGYLLKPSD